MRRPVPRPGPDGVPRAAYGLAVAAGPARPRWKQAARFLFAWWQASPVQRAILAAAKAERETARRLDTPGGQAGQPLAREVITYLGERGYELYDVPGFPRRPSDGALGQMDLAFAREKGILRSSSEW